MLASVSKGRRGMIAAVSAAPVLVIFLSSNLVNAGNMLFNVLFSRWMGPEVFGQLASILTIKLALLGVLGALQMAVSQRVSSTTTNDDSLNAAIAWLSRICFLALWLALPVVFGVIWSTDLHGWLGLETPILLFLFALSMPFAVPLSLLRGVAIGRLDVRSVVLSANIEMAVRLLGGILFWTLGGGLTGVVLAVSLSILAGWAPLARLMPHETKRTGAWRTVRTAVISASLPFALLQVSQVILLDADVFVARVALGDEEAGLVAALSLFQRVQFFACFGLAGVLLPMVAGALASGGSALRPTLAVLAFVMLVSATCLFGALSWPELLLSGLVGEAFLPAADALLPAAAAAVAFTVSYLGATLLVALGDRTGVWLLVATCPLQISLMTLGTESLTGMMTAKLVCQSALCLLVVGKICLRLWPSADTGARFEPLS